MAFYLLRKTTLIDFPGRVAAAVFSHGCNFRCPFCHNPELVVKPSSESFMKKDEVFKFLEKRADLLDGVVFSGGEPLLNKEIDDLIKGACELGYEVKIDTNGSYPLKIKEYLEEKWVDYWAMDIKNGIGGYSRAIGVEVSLGLLEKVRESISLIMNAGVEYEFRTTVVPGLHDIAAMHGIGKLIEGAEKFVIQNFRGGETLDPAFAGVRGFDDRMLNKFKEVMESYVGSVEIKN